MTENFTDKIGLKEIADSVHLSPNYFHKLFSTITGIIPHDFLMKKRINYAKELIMTSEHDMMEISMLSGFESQAYFNYCFKKSTGLSPMKYRQKEFEKYGITPNIKIKTNQLYTIKELIKNNNLGAFIFNQVIENDSSIIGIPLEEPVDLEIVIASRKDSHLNNVAKGFLKFIIECQKI